MVDIESLRDPEQLRNVCRAYEASHRILNRQIEDLVREIADLKGIDTAQARLELPDLQCHLDNILTYGRHRTTNTTTEGINSKIMAVERRAVGYSEQRPFQDRNLFHLGWLGSIPTLNPDGPIE